MSRQLSRISTKELRTRQVTSDITDREIMVGHLPSPEDKEYMTGK